MKSLPTKLRQNHHRRIRDVILAKATPMLSRFLADLEYCSDASVIANAAFSTWGIEEDNWTTTRGHVDNWKKFDFPAWPALTSDLQRLSFPKDSNGWLFFDPDGPYFRLSSTKVYESLDLIAEFASKENHNEFAWIGDDQDCGVIVEFEHTSFCKNDFSYCTWDNNA